jgi:glycosyltransferase involved in cell wall biosynthesis
VVGVSQRQPRVIQIDLSAISPNHGAHRFSILALPTRTRARRLFFKIEPAVKLGSRVSTLKESTVNCNRSSPKVSVVIPVFNGERFIGAAIRSALGQTFRDFEIIVVDDGSTDQTEKIVRQFSDRVAYHRQQNRGAGAARNLGVMSASGEWIAFLDADDIWYPQKLAVQFEAVAMNPAIAFVYSDMDTIDVHEAILQRNFLTTQVKRRRWKKNRDLVSLVFGGQPFPYPSTVLLKRERFSQSGGFSPLFRRNYHEDFDLFARIAHVAPLHFVPQSLVQYRKMPSARIGNDWYDANYLLLLERLAELWRDHPDRLKRVEWFFDKHAFKQGRTLLRSGEWLKARECFYAVFRRRPFYFRNLRWWALSYLPVARQLYRGQKSTLGRFKRIGQ